MSSVAESTSGPDVSDVQLFLRAVRRELNRLPTLVRDVDVNDRARARLVANHAEALLDGLYLHQTSEYELLWPRLKHRAPSDVEQLSGMQEQQQDASYFIEEIRKRLVAWRCEGKAAVRDELVVLIEKLRGWVTTYLDQDESIVLPLAEKTITRDEWKLLAELRFSAMPSGQVHLHIGSLLENATPTESSRLLQQLPLDVRIGWMVNGHRAYGRHMRKLNREQ